jgi:hypothetical protein
VLEDRIVPATYRHFGPPPPAPAPAVHLQVIVPTNIQEGKATTVTVEAENASNQVVTNFKGVVQITLGTADPDATLPASFTFAASDKGKHTFQVTFQTPGAQTLIATSGLIAGQTPLMVGSVVTHFGVYAGSQATAGYATLVQVVALDAHNNIAADYRGTVHFSNTDAFAPQLDDYTFQASDNGSHLFAVNFATPGQQTLITTDMANKSIVGGVNVNVSSPWYYLTYNGWGYHFWY